MRLFLLVTVSAVSVLSAASVGSPASAGPGLAVGTCVLADKLYHGKIVAVNHDDNGSYTIADSQGRPDYRLPNRIVVAAPCAGTQAETVNAQGDRPQANNNPQPGHRPQVQRTLGGACFGSEPDAARGLEGTFRGVIRRQFERKAAPGSDGTTTLRFMSFRMDGGRRATVIDRVNYKPDMSKPVYSIRALFQTCTDYRRATTTKTLERNFQCYTSSTGGPNCSASGSMAGMRRDESVYTPK
jgi:hypothetical protein